MEIKLIRGIDFPIIMAIQLIIWLAWAGITWIAFQLWVIDYKTSLRKDATWLLTILFVPFIGPLLYIYLNKRQ